MELTVEPKPRTAGPRVLVIEGGGVRGIVPLRIMLSLQERLGPKLPLYDMVDLAVGTSSGE